MPQPVCVFCRRHPVDPAWRPFCSERCKLQDLARWVDGHVAAERVTADETENDELRKTKSRRFELSLLTSNF